jgi:Gpi18-like mannosyltransferase
LRRWPWWLSVTAIFVISRVVTTSILLAFAAAQAPTAWADAQPDYFSFATMWDANWYYIISVVGYPSELPVTADGHIGESAWAFMPVYPMLLAALGWATGLPFAVLAVSVSVVFGLGAALMFYRLMNLVLPAGTALFSVVLFCFAPLSPLLQLAYAESLHMFLLVIALYLLVKRQYWMLAPVLAVASLTRPSGLAFALALLLHVIYRWAVRARDPFPVAERVASVSVAVFSGVMGLVWPITAWIVTGSLTAYTDTELAWRAPYVGYGELIPFAPWIQGANWWIPKPFGPILLVLTIGLFVCFMFSPWVKRLGVDLRLWVASYVLYLLAVFFPQSSTFRLLIPVFPLLGALAVPRSLLYRTLLVAAFIAGQVGWIYIAWWVDGYDWTPP